MSQSIFLSVRQAVEAFRISRRTLERRLSDGSIHQSQVRHEGKERLIPIAELIRVFGEPKGELKDDPTTPHPPDRAQNAGQTDEIARRLIERLESDLERERVRADQERERANRYETELSEARRRNDELTQRLLPAPHSSGLFARLFKRS